MVLKYYAATAAGAILILLSTREKLFQNNLTDNGFGTRSAEKIVCDERSKGARTEDGSCADLDQPLMGAANVPLGRNVAREAIRKGEGIKLMEPNPIAVSRELLRREGEMKPLPLNLFVTAWIQFQNHDWFDHNNTEFDYKSYHKVPIPAEYRSTFRQDGITEALKSVASIDNTMLVPRTKDVATQKDKDGKEYPVFVNQVTHWWDASQVYGSDAKVSARLRSFEGGRMKVDEDNLIPRADEDEEINDPKLGYATGFQKDIEKTGFAENWWVGMSLLHNAFVRNHNLIVSDPDFVAQVKAQLAKSKEGAALLDATGQPKDAKAYAKALDQMLYDKARLINVAIIAKIHTIEWTPSVFDTSPLDYGMRANWFGLLEGQLDKNVVGRKFWDGVKKAAGMTGADQVTKKQKVFGILGGYRDLYNVPFTITEEFTSVYRLHSLLPETISLRNTRDEPQGEFPIKETRLVKNKAFMASRPLADIYYSFGHTKSGQLVLGNFPKFMQEIEVPILGKLDMGAIDVFRDRERGVPRYNDFRREILLSEIVSFPDLFAYASNLKIESNECDTLDQSLLALSEIGHAKISMLDRWAYTAKDKREKLTPFDLKHCRLQKMNARVDAYRALAALDSRTSQDNDRMAELTKQIHADIAEREAGLTPENKIVVEKMRKLYNTPSLVAAFQLPHQKSLGLRDNVDALDLMIGTHAETFRNPAEPEKGFIGLGLGETQFQIFVLMASRRLLADRFFTVDFRPEVYTRRGMDIVNAASMKGVLTCNLKKEFPEIEKAMTCIRSAFHPWNDVSKGEPVCDPKRKSQDKRDRQMLSLYKSLCNGA